jgi:hypothetical protein
MVLSAFSGVGGNEGRFLTQYIDIVKPNAEIWQRQNTCRAPIAPDSELPLCYSSVFRRWPNLARSRGVEQAERDRETAELNPGSGSPDWAIERCEPLFVEVITVIKYWCPYRRGRPKLLEGRATTWCRWQAVDMAAGGSDRSNIRHTGGGSSTEEEALITSNQTA